MYTWWIKIFYGLSHPLWFPLLCLAILPVVAFVHIKVIPLNNLEQAPHVVFPFQIELDTQKSREFHQQSGNQTQMISVALLFIYYVVFLYDLIKYCYDDPDSDANIVFTHAIDHEEYGLQVVYIFHHWSRPLASVVRNCAVLKMLHSFDAKLGKRKPDRRSILKM